MAGKVFISHASDDTARCAPLLRAFDAWGVDYWFDSQEHAAGQQLSDRAQMALAECTVFLRICTRATRQSYWMSLEAGAFVSLQADDHRLGRSDRRLVNLILDPAYTHEPFDRTVMLIDAEGGKHPGWVNELRAVLGLPPLTDPSSVSADLFPPAPGISRRRALGMGVGAATALVAAGGAGVLWLSRSRPPGPGPDATPTLPVKDANLLWARSIGTQGVLGGGNGVSATPLLSGDTLYLGSQDGHFYAIDTHGAIKWSKLKLGYPVYQPAVVIEGTVFFCTAGDDTGGTGGEVFACDATTGAELWHNQGPTWTFTTLTAAAGRLYVSGIKYDGFLSIFDPATGKEVVYLHPSTDLVLPVSPPLIAGSVLYINADDGYLYALDANKPGNELWRADVGATQARKTGNKVYSTSAPTVALGLIYVGSGDATIYAFDPATGALRWKYVADAEILHSSPVVAGGTLYIGSRDHNLYAIDAVLGELKWRYQTGKAIRSTPAVLGNVVYIGSDDDMVHAVDATTGTLVRKYPTTADVVSTPVIANGVMYVTSLDGYLYAYKV